MKKTNMLETTTPIIITKYLFFAAMALFGGIVHALIAKKNNEIKTWQDVIILSIISGFTGCMWTLLALAFYPENVYLVGFAAGTGGYLSTEGLTWAIALFKNKLK